MELEVGMLCRHVKPWQRSEVETQSQLVCLNSTCCNPTQTEAGMPAGHEMKGLLPVGPVLHGYNLESQIPGHNCLFYIRVSPAQNTWGLSSFDALKPVFY